MGGEINTNRRISSETVNLLTYYQSFMGLIEYQKKQLSNLATSSRERLV